MSADSSKNYTIGHKESALAYMRFRTAERCCGFFRRHVDAASRILDCGCGPGSITTGLAQWAPHGQTVGIDIGVEQLERARALAREMDVRNVTFREGDIFGLPFDSGSFDIVFAQAVFIHIPDHDKALSEIKRVLRPGGLVAIRDIINRSILYWPDDPLIGESPRLFRLGMQRSGGNPDVGLELGTLLLRAGFSDVFVNFAFEQPERPEERASYYAVVADMVAGDIGALGVREGWITKERLAHSVARIRDLAHQDDAIRAIPFGQATGRKPA